MSMESDGSGLMVIGKRPNRAAMVVKTVDRLALAATDMIESPLQVGARKEALFSR
jgi:hypothetical protein